MTEVQSFPEEMQLPPVEELKLRQVSIVVADWNKHITYALLDGAIETLVEEGMERDNIDVIHVPGTIELTYAARCAQKRSDAVIIIGCVIKGDTPHFDYVCQSVTQGMTILNAEGKVPVIFSVLTVLNEQQAIDRAGGRLGNKGSEAALTAMRMLMIR